MVKIRIDGTYYEAEAGRNLLETCITLGIDIPYFCYHPAMGSVGACRQCAVKKYANENDKTGKIVMSCMEPVTDGMIVSADGEDAKKFRAAIIEGLMTNHPHDCPVCDEGGECHLQDMTVKTGHNYSRFVFKKRTHKNQYLGPFIQHEMNRCIQCYRCVRFYKDYAGGKDLNVFGSANQVYFGRHQEGLLESEFSGNLVEVCPTGVFTDKTLKKHYTRKWDMSNGPSVCVHCSLGCNSLISERYGSVRRTMSRYNGSINGYFLCDRGRFGYEFINNPERIKKLQVRISKKENLLQVTDLSQIDGLGAALADGRMMGIGSPRASLEANFALSSLVGKENFFHGISGKEYQMVKKAIQILGSGIAQVPSLKETEQCDAIFILGEDVTNTAPMMALSLRQAIRNKSIGIAGKMGIPKWNDAAVRQLNHEVKSPLYIATPYSTKLDDLAKETWYAAPENIAGLGFTVASFIDSNAPGTDPDVSFGELAGKIANDLVNAENPLIVTGITGGSPDILRAASNIAIALSRKGKKPNIAITFPECNSTGLGMMDGSHLDDALDRIEKNPPETLIILENDLYRRISAEKAAIFLEKCNHVIVMDHLMHSTAKKADMVLPTAVYAESAGTLVNNEGRAQRYYSALPLNGQVKENWQWISELMKLGKKNHLPDWDQFDQVVASLVNSYTIFKGIKEQMPDAGFRFYNEKIARQTMRFSGRTASQANVSVSEPGPPRDDDSPLDYSMEGFKGYPPANLIPFYWSPGWNSVQAVNKYMEEPDGPLNGGNPGVKLLVETVKPKSGYDVHTPDPFKPRADELNFIPVFRIFGSEELSSHAQAVSELIPKPFVLLSKKDAENLGIINQKNYKISVNHIIIDAIALTDDHIPDGLAGLSCLLPGMPFIDLPGSGRFLPD